MPTKYYSWGNYWHFLQNYFFILRWTFSGCDKISAFFTRNVFKLKGPTKYQHFYDTDKMKLLTIGIFSKMISSFTDECCQVLMKYRLFSRNMAPLFAEKLNGPTKISAFSWRRQDDIPYGIPYFVKFIIFLGHNKVSAFL